MNAKQSIEKIVDEINKHDVQALIDQYRDDAIVHDPAHPEPGPMATCQTASATSSSLHHALAA